MKAIILAAGSGTRLRPLTDRTPQCLLPIQGVPLLRIWLENCAAAGISEVLVNVHSHAEMVRDFARREFGSVRIHIVEEQQLLGSAGTLAENRGFVASDKAFLVLYADVLTNVSLPGMMPLHRQNKTPVTLGIYRVPDPAQCGIVTTDDAGVVRSFVEKPTQPASAWAFSGIMVSSPQVIKLVPEQRPADIGYHLLPQLIGQMTAYPIQDYLIDIGTMSTYQAVQFS